MWLVFEACFGCITEACDPEIFIHSSMGISFAMKNEFIL